MIPVGVAIAPGSGLWQATAWSDAFLVVLSAGVLGMGLTDLTSGITDRLSGDDGADDLDDFDDGDDLLADGDDTSDDEFGDLDGWEDGEDEFDDFGDGDGALDEIEPRLNELENELASISSTMGTVRSENDAINETVDDIEDNIRKLLEIYEMVTRGVNPFVDDVEGSAGMGGSFGLFDGENSGSGGSEDIDPEVAEADADSFFDDDWDDEGFDDGEGFDDDDGLGDGEFDDAAFDGGEVGTGESAEEATESEPAEGGKTFDQLKSEYEEGNAEWDGSDGGGTSDSTDAEAPDNSTTAGADANDSPDAEIGGDENVGAVESAADDNPDSGNEVATGATGNSSSEGDDSSSQSDGKPYLRTLPSGYGTELLVIEWLSYLRSCSSTPEALRAIRYYETIGWIGEPAADALAKLLTGLTDEDVAPVPSGGTQLTVDHHTQSLRYIGRLGGAEVQIERLDWTRSPRQSARIEGGKKRGIQR